MDRASMESENKRVFPLSREFFYEEFTFYYPFGNTPAEDFLRSVAVTDSREPSVLSLGCGGMRSPMFTIMKNFGYDGGMPPNGFTGVHFVLNDYNASVLARNVLILYLCKQMPSSKEERKQWLASVWSIWYNHEWLPEHHEMFRSALKVLCEWSRTQEDWLKSPLGHVLKFSSPATFAAVKMVWKKWGSFSMSVEEMKSKKYSFQSHHMKLRTSASSIEEGLKMFAETDPLLQSVQFLYSKRMYSLIKKEHWEYLLFGTIWVEKILGISIHNPRTVVNPTFFDQDNGSYTLQYSLTPYVGFMLGFQYTQSAVGTVGRNLPVADAKFKSKPLLANCFQQFSMWLQATGNALNNGINISFAVVLESSISLCLSLIQCPDIYDLKKLDFDAIFSSNLLDHVSPPALIIHSLALLSPTGTLFTETFHGTVSSYLEDNFGFPPELFPAFLGISCVGHDGPYSPTISHNPKPEVMPHRINQVFIWRKVTPNELVFNSVAESPLALKCLLKSCAAHRVPGPHDLSSAESFLCILHQFLWRVQFTTLCHQFLQPLSDEIKNDVWCKDYLLQLQTQSLLHGIHMHLILTEIDCPICQGLPVKSYVQQFTLSLDIDKCSVLPYDPPAFEIQLSSFSNAPVIITSYVINKCGSSLNITFLLPKNHLSCYKCVQVFMYQSTSKKKSVYYAPVETIACCSTYEFVFMKVPETECRKQIATSVGDIAKHVVDSCHFETVMSMSDLYDTSLKMEPNFLKSDQLQLSCGELKSTISYPYSVDESKAHIKISKKKRTITVLAERKHKLINRGKPTYLINPMNELLHPKFCWGSAILDKYCNFMLPQIKCNPSVLDAKSSFREIIKYSFNNKKVFTFSFPSKRFTGAPDVHAVFYVHELRFSTEYTSPMLDVSYCFLHNKPKLLMPKFHALHSSLCPSVDVTVDEAEYQFLQDLFQYFSSTIRHSFPSNLNKITKAIEKQGLWEHFDHAVLFPLYPNPASPVTCSGAGAFSLDSLLGDFPFEAPRSELTQNIPSFTPIPPPSTPPRSMSDKSKSKTTTPNQKSHCKVCARCKKPATITCRCDSVYYCSTVCQTLEGPAHAETCIETQRTPRSKTLEEKGSSYVVLKCSNCGKTKSSLKHCKCRNVAYCNIECQRLHWPQHKANCAAIKH